MRNKSKLQNYKLAVLVCFCCDVAVVFSLCDKKAFLISKADMSKGTFFLFGHLQGGLAYSF